MEHLREPCAGGTLHPIRSRPAPTVAPLAPEEVAHYRWLVDGILRGLSSRAADRDDPVAIVAHETLRDLFDEFLARVEEPID